MSCRRAISATRLPSTSASAKIRTFSSTDQRRRRSGPVKTSWRIAYLVDDVHNDVANDVNYPPKPSPVRRPKAAGYLLVGPCCREVLIKQVRRERPSVMAVGGPVEPPLLASPQ